MSGLIEARCTRAICEVVSLFKAWASGVASSPLKALRRISGVVYSLLRGCRSPSKQDGDLVASSMMDSLLILRVKRPFSSRSLFCLFTVFMVAERYNGYLEDVKDNLE